jgi:hypothetical protein
MTDAGRTSKRRVKRAPPREIERAALGTTPPPEPAPPGARVDASEHLVPGAGFDDRPRTESKPWFTSLAAESGQAGVANDPSDAQDAAFDAGGGERPKDKAEAEK